MLIRPHIADCPRHQRGASLIELLIAVAIVTILLAAAIPNFQSWILNSRIRTTADSIQNGLQLAKAEAVNRNASVGFYLTDTADNSCVLSTNGLSWAISLSDPTSKCATRPPVLQARSAAEGSKNLVLTAGQPSVIFNSLGQATLPASPASSSNTINLANTSGGTCVAAGGSVRCLRVVVNSSGLIRMCDPAVASPDSRAC